MEILNNSMSCYTQNEFNLKEGKFTSEIESACTANQLSAIFNYPCGRLRGMGILSFQAFESYAYVYVYALLNLSKT